MGKIKYRIPCKFIPQESAIEFESRETDPQAKAVHCETHAEFQYDCIDCSDALRAARGW